MKRGSAAKYEDEALKWLLSVEPGIVREVDFAHVQSVMERVGDVIDHERESGKDEADPYVLALAVAMRSEGRAVRIITEDRRDGLKLSLTTAAGILDLTAVPLLGFIRAERLL